MELFVSVKIKRDGGDGIMFGGENVLDVFVYYFFIVYRFTILESLKMERSEGRFTRT